MSELTAKEKLRYIETALMNNDFCELCIHGGRNGSEEPCLNCNFYCGFKEMRFEYKGGK